MTLDILSVSALLPSIPIAKLSAFHQAPSACRPLAEASSSFADMNIPDPLPLLRSSSSTGSFSFYPFSLNPLASFTQATSSPLHFPSSSPPLPELQSANSLISTERPLSEPQQQQQQQREEEQDDSSGDDEEPELSTPASRKRVGAPNSNSNSRSQKRRPSHSNAGSDSPVVDRAAKIVGQPFDTLVTSTDQHWIRLDPNKLERFQFVNRPFNVDVFLVDKKDNMKIGWSVPLRVDLLYDNGELVANQADVFSYSVKSGQPRVGNGLLTMAITMKHVSVGHENRGFKLRFSCQPDPMHGAIHPETSTAVTVIRHRLRITKEPDSEWFKDEGGRDKCLEITALLVDDSNNLVKNREIPLRVTLLYESEQIVQNQAILKVINGSRPCVDKSGRVQLRVRIEEVSKNHQKQAFCIKLEPDAAVCPSNCDVSSAITAPVRVRSKRSRQRRNRADTEADAMDGSELLLSAARQTPRGSLKSSPPSPPPSTPSTTHREREQQQQQHSYSPRSHENQSKTPVVATPANTLSSNSNSSLTSLNQLNNINSNLSAISNRLQSVMGWCSAVASGLRDMEWQTIGYEMDETGVPNKSRPIQRCPSCWAYKDAMKCEHGPRCMIHPALASFTSIIEPLLQSSSASPLPSTPSQQQSQQPFLPPLPPFDQTIAALSHFKSSTPFSSTAPSPHFSEPNMSQNPTLNSSPNSSSNLNQSAIGQSLIPPSAAIAPLRAALRSSFSAPPFTPPSFSFVSSTSTSSSNWNAQDNQRCSNEDRR